MDVTFNERTKCAAEISPGWSEAEPWVTTPIGSKARFSGRKTSSGKPFCRPLKRARCLFLLPDPGLRCACPGLNSAAGDAGSLNHFLQSTRNLRFEFILGPTPEGGH
jgi:hypothetical protein